MHPWALIIGNRKLTQETVPKSTKFGRHFSNFWVQYQTGIPIADSQSGFRIYPLFHLQHLKFWTKRYDFEIEVLIRLIWKNVSIQEVAIEVFYPPQSERISHFRKFLDNARISILNVFLVALSLIRKNKETSKTALALGLGVFVGCTPFFGFHSFIALALAFFLRLNAPLIWLGTQISLPFIAPFLAMLSIFIGRTLRGEGQSLELIPLNLQQASQSFSDWLLGSLILGVFLGLLIGISTLWISKKMNRKNQRPWTGKSRGGAFGNWFLKKWIYYFGIKAGYGFLFFLVPYFFIFSPSGRRASLEYWRISSPHLKKSKTILQVLKHFYCLGTLLLDRVYQSFFLEPKFEIESEGYENITTLLDSKKGSILLGAHVGAWEMAARYLPPSDLKQRFCFIQYQAEGPKPLEGEEEKNCFHVLYVNEEENIVLKIHSLLQQGKMICLMGDRAMDTHYELVRFFGKLAPFAATPFKIAATCQVPLLISFGFKKGPSTYSFKALSPKHCEYMLGQNKDLQILEWIQDYAQELEKTLKDFPEQWFNFYPFWSVLPVLEKRETAKRVRRHSVKVWSAQTKN